VTILFANVGDGSIESILGNMVGGFYSSIDVVRAALARVKLADSTDVVQQ
jgi:hypothetical protein